MNQLEALKQFSTVVADSSNIESIIQYRPKDATTNPSIILKSINLKIYQDMINNAIEYAKKQGGNKEIKIINASDKFAVNIGTEILRYIPGHISTEIDARLSFDTLSCINRAKRIIKMYKDNGIDRSRVLIKLASTWEGIQAARELEKDGIKCNLTLIFSIIQAKAAAEAKVFLISPFVGRVYDWYNDHNLISPYSVQKDQGVKLIYDIYNYYKCHGYNTIIMGASFRKKEQIIALAGCDYLTISPNFLNELKNSNEPLLRTLKNPYNTVNHNKSVPISESEFRWEHNQNPMAIEKLSEGIRTFSFDQQKLEQEMSLRI
ncbi:transaldolase [Pantoea sp. SoEX]|uniref:transaldolase n=1 Tax=Pantoea sp. SoEX TaxID=2576763 RepID=UPI0013587713|nr:transaldolase [Pantoea sp. SoEX]MXP50849.1 transaldolase [Pantoea sp. SoEX]